MKPINEAIIKKIKGLLAIANDNKDDEESQSAFLLAQKLMIKHNISMASVEGTTEKIAIQKGQVTAYKKLFWWERKLAIIISDNFRVKNYINWKRLNGSVQRKNAIMFFGYEQDVELAKEMYILAYDALKFYSNKFVENYYQNKRLRLHRITADVKDSYMRGFLEGLDNKFLEQVEKMEQEYGLMLLTPKEVESSYNEFSKDFGKLRSLKIPNISEIEAYHEGFSDAKSIDYTKSTIHDDIIQS